MFRVQYCVGSSVTTIAKEYSRLEAEAVAKSLKLKRYVKSVCIIPVSAFN